MAMEADRGARAAVPDTSGTDRYEVRRRLGSGSFGVVCEGWDRERQGSVAMKWLGHVDAETIHRFKREFRSLAEISHPNLVQLYELASDGDRWFFTMELVRGVTLPEHLRPEMLPGTWETAHPESLPTLRDVDSLARARRASRGAARTLDVDAAELRALFAQLAQGVCALHGAGKLHRDLKCQNVMVTPARRVVLLDFGLVREVDASRADDGEIVGTPVYMAPEQCAGAPIGPAADWYAVGVMLFRALTDRFPFDGRSLEVMRAKQSEDAPRPSEIVGGVPLDLDELCVELLARDPAARPTGPDVLRRLGATSGPSAAYPPRPAEVFVGRRAELRVIELERRAVRREGPRLVYVHGKSGLGKTALVQRALARASDTGALVLEGRCFERETLPYKALDSVVDAIVAHLRKLPPGQIEDLVPRRAADVVRVFPALARVPAFERSARPSSEVPDPQEQRRLAIEGFGDLLRRLSREREVIVSLDDLQWGDRDSATVVAGLLEMHDVPVLWLGTYRTEEASSSAYLQYLGDSRVSRIELRELGDADAQALLEAGLGAIDLDVLERLTREAAGSPLFIDLLVRRARDAPLAGHLELGDIIRERLDALAPEARELLSVLAVGGRPLEPALVAAALALDAVDVTTVTHLRNARLLRVRDAEGGQAIELYHDRIREAVGAQLSPERERALHGALASALLARDADPERLAYHFRGAGRPAEALRFTIDAARRADRALAFERAAELYATALALFPQVGRGAIDLPLDARAVRVARADALRNAGRGAEAARTYLAAASEASPDRARPLRRLAAEQYLLSGHIDDGLAVARTILRELGARVPENKLRVLGEFFYRRAQLALRGLRFEEREPSPYDDAKRELVDLLWAVAGGLAMVDPVEGGVFQARCLLLSLDLGDLDRISRAVAMEIPFSATAGMRRRARTAELERLGAELADRARSDYTYGLLSETRAGAAWLEGRWTDALPDGERGIEIHRKRCTGVAWEITIVTIVVLDVLYRTGRWPELFERYPALLADATSRGDLLLEVYLRVKFRTLSLLAGNRPDEAMAEAHAAIASWSQRGYTLLHLWQLFGSVECHLYAGRPGAAREHLERGWKSLHDSQLLRVQVYSVTMHDLRGRVALACAADGDRGARLAEAQAAADRIERLDAPWGRGLVLALRAGIASARAERARASRLFAQAEDELRAGDMTLHALAMRARRARLEGDVRALEEVCARIVQLGVVRPEPWIDLLAPGRYSD